MDLEQVRPPHCHARAQRLLAEVTAIRDELGRSEDRRPLPELSEARPREVYFEALATWHKIGRLAGELGGATALFGRPVPPLRELRPGHVLQVIDAVLAEVDRIKQQLHIAERCAEPAIEDGRQPSDVLVTLIRVNRELSRSLERPFTPGDVYRTVALASAYAARLGATAAPAPFERRRRPADCYAQLVACHTAVGALIAKRGETALAVRGAPSDVLPGDVYDMASLVLGDLAFLHALTPDAPAVHPFEPPATGYRLPAHVDQLARTLAAQLATIA